MRGQGGGSGRGAVADLFPFVSACFPYVSDVVGKKRKGVLGFLFAASVGERRRGAVAASVVDADAIEKGSDPRGHLRSAEKPGWFAFLFPIIYHAIRQSLCEYEMLGTVQTFCLIIDE